MDIIRAKEILTALADGVNPLTGEVLPPEDSCNQAEVVRALHAALAALNPPKQKNTPSNAGKPWSLEEDDRLRSEVQSGMSARKIAVAHERSRGAITSRIALLGIAQN